MSVQRAGRRYLLRYLLHASDTTEAWAFWGIVTSQLNRSGNNKKRAALSPSYYKRLLFPGQENIPRELPACKKECVRKQGCLSTHSLSFSHTSVVTSIGKPAKSEQSHIVWENHGGITELIIIFHAFVVMLTAGESMGSKESWVNDRVDSVEDMAASR